MIYADKRDMCERDGSLNVVDTDTGAIWGTGSNYEYLFLQTLDKKTIIFATAGRKSSRLWRICTNCVKTKGRIVYRVTTLQCVRLLRRTRGGDESRRGEIRHGSTVTLETWAVYIAPVPRRCSVGAPRRVQFCQRLGAAAGGQIPQLLFTFVESLKINTSECLVPSTGIYPDHWAIVELYLGRHWIRTHTSQASSVITCVYHQTYEAALENSKRRVTVCVWHGARFLAWGCFRKISQEDYKSSCLHLVDIEQLRAARSITGWTWQGPGRRSLTATSS